MGMEGKTLLNQKFPIEIFNFKKDLLQDISHSKYLLIDFWASYCHPCIEQIPKLIKLYNNYKEKGFNIHSISIDRKSDYNKMLKVIGVQKFRWKNDLDVDGSKSGEINVTAIPKNFLLNTTGKVVAVNLSMEELENFLMENIKMD